MMEWFRGGAKADEGEASDDLVKQGDKERDAGDLTAALHYYSKALAVAGSPEKRKAALLAQSRTYVLNGDLTEAEEAATRALDLGVCAPSLVRRGCARRKLGHFGADMPAVLDLGLGALDVALGLYRHQGHASFHVEARRGPQIESFPHLP